MPLGILLILFSFIINDKYPTPFIPGLLDLPIHCKSQLFGIISYKISNADIYRYIFNIVRSIDSSNDYDQLTIQYQKHFLTNLICNHTDKANMQHSVEARSPFLDPELFNFTNSLPQNLKLKNGTSKLILRNF